MRIRILDPHWNKMDPDPGHFFTDLLIFLTKKLFSNFLFYFFAYLILELDEAFRNEEIFGFILSSDLGFTGK